MGDLGAAMCDSKDGGDASHRYVYRKGVGFFVALTALIGAGHIRRCLSLFSSLFSLSHTHTHAEG